MGRTLLFLIAILISNGAVSQGSWNQLNDFPGGVHFTGAVFTIGDDAYYLEGHNSSTCFDRLWKFDVDAKTWTQKATFPGNMVKGDPVAFSIDSIGYIGTGKTCSDATGSEFWAYDPSTDSWSQKTDFPGSDRHLAVGFAIDGKGYIGMGRFAFSDYANDLYAYDPTTDSWTQKTSYPGDGPSATDAVTYNSQAYIATGAGSNNSGNGSTGFWKYEPSSDSWYQLPPFPGSARKAVSAFQIEEYIYYGMGWNATDYYRDLYRFDTDSGNWEQVSSFGGGKRRHAEEFAIGGKAYVIGGMDDQSNFRRDVWEFSSEFVSQKEFNKEESSFSVHPNPADKRVRIRMDGEQGTEDRIRIFSSKGQQIRTLSKESNSFSISINSLSSGIYIVERVNGTGEAQRRKLLVR